MEIAEYLSAVHSLRVLTGDPDQFWDGISLDEETAVSFHKLIPMPRHMQMTIPRKALEAMYHFEPHDRVEEVQIDTSLNALNPDHWAGWCLTNWGCLSDAIAPQFYDDYQVTFRTIGGVGEKCMLALARKFQLMDLHWRYLLNGQQTDLFLRGGGVFDITHDSFLLHPDDGEQWESKYMMNHNEDANNESSEHTGSARRSHPDH